MMEQDTDFLTHGPIVDGGLGLMPCLWLGTRLEGVEEAALPLLAQKEGQFLLEHQYGGLCCYQAQLYGVFLPLSTCDDVQIVQGFSPLARKYYDNPFASFLGSTIYDLVELDKKLKRIGPLDGSWASIVYQTHEAFLTFALRDEAYAWVRRHFRMVTKVTDFIPYGAEGVEILETAVLSPVDWQGFVDWLRPSAESIFPTGFFGAFLYENSD